MTANIKEDSCFDGVPVAFSPVLEVTFQQISIKRIKHVHDEYRFLCVLVVGGMVIT